MPGTIGDDSTAAGGGADIATTDTHKLMTNYGTYTATTNDQVTTIGFRAPGTAFYGDLEIGVYRTDTLALVASATVTSTAEGRFTTAITPVALTNGVTYAVAFRNADSTDVSVWRGYQDPAGAASDLTGSSALAATFTNNANHFQRLSIFAIVEASGGGGSGNIKSHLMLSGMGG